MIHVEELMGKTISGRELSSGDNVQGEVIGAYFHSSLGALVFIIVIDDNGMREEVGEEGRVLGQVVLRHDSLASNVLIYDH